MQDEDLIIRSFQSLSFHHTWFIVPAFTEVPVSETLTMQFLRRELKIRRKSIERMRHGSSPGETIHIQGTKKRILVCIVLAESPEHLSYKILGRRMAKCLRETVENTAIIGDGFRIPSDSKYRDEVENGFELLCRVLRKIGFSGVVYEPPEYELPPGSGYDCTDERVTDTRMIITPSGDIDKEIASNLGKPRDNS